MSYQEENTVVGGNVNSQNEETVFTNINRQGQFRPGPQIPKDAKPKKVKLNTKRNIAVGAGLGLGVLGAAAATVYATNHEEPKSEDPDLGKLEELEIPEEEPIAVQQSSTTSREHVEVHEVHHHHYHEQPAATPPVTHTETEDSHTHGGGITPGGNPGTGTTGGAGKTEGGETELEVIAVIHNESDNSNDALVAFADGTVGKLLDMDGDSVFDVLMIDANGDYTFDENDQMYDITDMQVTVQDMGGLTHVYNPETGLTPVTGSDEMAMTDPMDVPREWTDEDDSSSDVDSGALDKDGHVVTGRDDSNHIDAEDVEVAEDPAMEIEAEVAEVSVEAEPAVDEVIADDQVAQLDAPVEAEPVVEEPMVEEPVAEVPMAENEPAYDPSHDAAMADIENSNFEDPMIDDYDSNADISDYNA